MYCQLHILVTKKSPPLTSLVWLLDLIRLPFPMLQQAFSVHIPYDVVPPEHILANRACPNHFLGNSEQVLDRKFIHIWECDLEAVLFAISIEAQMRSQLFLLQEPECEYHS